ncbi:Uncharacterised protein [Chryseobacterium gleum]|uniref:Uncharacterized protein n=2 Tax=Chryseobacterium gleum TaxID=250 RepID=A0A448B3K9_CHRGE|nr:hypothetical protein [Chryseobacterium gleum]EFK36421.1 hypothetical protein HMPREF0204_11868 [Chryseobacterium gleum ATCC 35910]QQY33654.1 hypothetical protein I6I60_07790 [Chryseobacterium gleum]VEE08300.1 Uncharacterised protein [Chryseobacterium gleum]
MKTKIVLLFLLGWVGMVCGQMKVLSEIDSENFNYLKDTKTSSSFIQKITNSNDKTLECVIKKYTGLGLSDISENNVLEGKEKIGKYSVCLYDEGDIYRCNEKNENHQILIDNDIEVFTIVGQNNKRLLFDSDNGVFLIEISKDRINEKERDMLINFINIGYNCDEEIGTAVHPSTFNDDLRLIRNGVILNSSDNATNNNAVTFTNGTNDTRINVGANFNFKEKWFLNFGIYTASLKTGFLYSDKRWKDDIGALLTINRVVLNETMFFNKADCEKLSDKRKKYRDSIVAEYGNLKKSYDIYDQKLKKLIKDKENIENKSDYTEKDVKELKEIQKEISLVEKEIDLYTKIKSNSKKYIDSKLESFDKKNDILQGSKLHWIKATLDLSNQNVKLDTANLLSLVKDGEIKNFPKLSLELSYNFNRQKKTLLNAQGFLNVTMGSILDAGIGSEKPFLKEEDSEVFIFDKSGRQLGKYSYLKRAFWTLKSGAQGSLFVLGDFGITGYASHTFALQNMSYMDYRNRYTLLGGFIFKINNGEDNNKATFRILAGVENEPYHTRALKDSFMVKVSIGVPFGIFSKNK